jgi:HJR/Mrr/RecB family endonuclease
MGRRKSDEMAIAALVVVPLLLLFVVLRWLWAIGWRVHAYYRSREPGYQERHQAILKDANIALMSPVAFEHHCAAVLKTQGWMCKMTRASGDFGVDVIAECKEMRVVIQVKKWQAPVSLSAVQEVAAGAAMYKAGVAAVVSVSGYQPSAVRLAQANRVLLLSYEDLFDFTRRVPSVLR